MSYFTQDAREEVQEWLQEFGKTFGGEDHLVWFSELSSEFHEHLLTFLADKLFELKTDIYESDI